MPIKLTFAAPSVSLHHDPVVKMAAATTPLYGELPKFTVPEYVNKRVDLPAEAYVDLSAHVSSPWDRLAQDCH